MQNHVAVTADQRARRSQSVSPINQPRRLTSRYTCALPQGAFGIREDEMNAAMRDGARAIAVDSATPPSL